MNLIYYIIFSQKYGGGLEGAITALQHTFENTIQDDDNLHDLARKGKYQVKF